MLILPGNGKPVEKGSGPSTRLLFIYVRTHHCTKLKIVIQQFYMVKLDIYIHLNDVFHIKAYEWLQ